MTSAQKDPNLELGNKALRAIKIQGPMRSKHTHTHTHPDQNPYTPNCPKPSKSLKAAKPLSPRNPETRNLHYRQSSCPDIRQRSKVLVEAIPCALRVCLGPFIIRLLWRCLGSNLGFFARLGFYRVLGCQQPISASGSCNMSRVL